MNNLVILLSGLPGTGKSNSGKALEEKLPDYDFHSRLAVRKDLGHKKYYRRRNPEVNREWYRRVKQSLDDGRGVIVDGVLFSHLPADRARQSFYDLASQYGTFALVIEHVCPQEVAKGRIRLKPKNDGLVMDSRDPSVYDKYKRRWEDIAEDLKVDTNGHVSYIRYNSHTLEIDRIKVIPQIKPQIERIVGVLALRY